MSAAHCQGNVMEFQSVWGVVTLFSVNFAKLSRMYLNRFAVKDGKSVYLS